MAEAFGPVGEHGQQRGVFDQIVRRGRVNRQHIPLVYSAGHAQTVRFQAVDKQDARRVDVVLMRGDGCVQRAAGDVQHLVRIVPVRGDGTQIGMKCDFRDAFLNRHESLLSAQIASFT